MRAVCNWQMYCCLEMVVIYDRSFIDSRVLYLSSKNIYYSITFSSFA